MDVEIVKSEFVPVENGTKDQSKVNGPVPSLTEAIMFGSHGLEEAVSGPETNLPKNATDDWPEDKVPKQVHTFYVVKFQKYDDPKHKPIFDAAQKDLHNKDQARYQIIEKLRAIRAKRTKLSELIGPLSVENTRFKSLLEEKKKEMEPVNKLLNELRPNKPSREKGAVHICSSEEDLNRTIKSLQYRIQHESIPLTEEKQILREIKQFEGTRAQIIATAKNRAEIEVTKGTKADLQDQYNQMGEGFSGVKKERQVVTTKLKQLLDEKTEINKDIKKIEVELDAATEKRDKAKDALNELRKKFDDGNACFYQNRALVDKARKFASKKDLASLKEFSSSELEKFMKMWNESKSFRDDYEKRILPSLDYRQFSRDGRMRSPDEKPLVVPPASSKPDQSTALKPKQMKHDSVSILQNGTEKIEKIQKEVKTKPIKEVKSKEVERVDEDEKEEVVEIEMPKKVEKKVDEAKLKEIKKEEEIAKSKLALERKKKRADKKAANSAIKAQREAEKKEKEREKKLKKKAIASGLVPEPEEQPTEAEAEVPEPEKAEETTEKSVISKSKGRNKENSMHNRTRSKGPDAISKVILKRKKSTNYWVWAAPAAVSIMMVFVIGYKYLI